MNSLIAAELKHRGMTGHRRGPATWTCASGERNKAAAVVHLQMIMRA